MESCVDNHWGEDCRLGSTYIGKDSDKLVSNDFHNGVVKVQTAALMLLTPGEEAVVRCQTKDGRVDGEQVSEVASPAHSKTVKIAYKEQMKKKRKERDEDKHG
jgi:proline racemase